MDIARLVTVAKRLGDLEAADKADKADGADGADGAGWPFPIDVCSSDAEVEVVRRILEDPGTGWEERGRTPGSPLLTDPPQGSPGADVLGALTVDSSVSERRPGD